MNDLKGNVSFCWDFDDYLKILLVFSWVTTVKFVAATIVFAGWTCSFFYNINYIYSEQMCPLCLAITMESLWIQLQEPELAHIYI